MSVRLCDLTGHHLLSGVEILSSEETGYGVRFCLDGVTFLALQDECDGYRSLCRELEVSQLPPSTMFPPQEVLGYMEEEGEYGREVLALVDFSPMRRSSRSAPATQRTGTPTSSWSISQNICPSTCRSRRSPRFPRRSCSPCCRERRRFVPC